MSYHPVDAAAKVGDSLPPHADDLAARSPRFGVVTALPKEFAAITAMLDGASGYPADGDGEYVVGSVPGRDGGTHVVVATVQTKPALAMAATSAAHLLNSFPSVEHVLMVGIAGAVPDRKHPERHVRLGDIVVSNEYGVVQYDHVKRTPDKTEFRSTTPPPSAALLNKVRLLESERLRGVYPWEQYIGRAAHIENAARPDDSTDRLYSSSQSARRLAHPRDEARRAGQPTIHYGRIGSSSTLLADPKVRDDLRDRFAVRAIEMEAAGVADSTWSAGVGYLVIRGTSDYCDPHKGDGWQGYAAVVAAAYAKAVIETFRAGGHEEVFLEPVESNADVPMVVTVAPPLGKRASPLRGRDGMVSDLMRTFNSWAPGSHVNVLHGLGGSGKSSIAVEVAARAVECGVPVWWVEPISRAAFESSIRVVSGQAGVDVGDLDRADLPDVLWKVLSERADPWLLVLDNIEDPSLLDVGTHGRTDGRGWIREVPGRGLVLITSRDGTARTWGPWRRRLVGMLKPEVAASVLLDRTGGRAGSTEAAESLAARLGCLPLALHLAGNYLAKTTLIPSDWSADLRTFDEYEAVLNEGGGLLSPPGSDGHITRVWELSLDLLERRGMPQARTLLRLLSCFEDASIPYGLVLQPHMMAKSGLFPDLDGLKLASLLDALAGLGLVDLVNLDDCNDAMPLANIHRLVRDASRARYEDSRQSAAYLGLAVALARRAAEHAGDPASPSGRRNWQSLARHCTHIFNAVADSCELARDVKLNAAIAAQHASGYLSARGLYSAAETGLRAVLTCEQTILDQDDPNILDVRNDLAKVLREEGRLPEAEDEQRTVHAIRQRTLGEHHSATLDTFQELAVTFAYEGRHGEARDIYLSVYETCLATLGKHHPETLTARHGLACRQYYDGDLDGAADEFRTIYMALENNPERGPAHLDTLFSRNWLADILTQQGKLAEAEAERRAVLQLSHDVLLDDHPITMATQRGLAIVLRSRARQTIAAEISRQKESKGGGEMVDEHYDATQSTNGSPLDSAQSALEEARGLVDSATDPGLYGVLCHDIADVQKAKGALPEATANYREAVENKRRRTPTMPTDMLVSQVALGGCLVDGGDYEEARAILDKARDEWGAAEGKATIPPARKVGPSYGMGTLYERLGQAGQPGAYQTALSVYQETVDLLEPDAKTSDYATVWRDIGDVLGAQGEHQRAADAYETAVDHQKRLGGGEQLVTLLRLRGNAILQTAQQDGRPA